MISRIFGECMAVRDTSALIRVGGLQYEVFIPRFSVDQLRERVGDEVELYTFHYIEGSAAMGNLFPRLVGFLRLEEREFFELYISVPGLGVRRALKSLSLPVDQIARAIEVQDHALLKTLPEVGTRVAEKMVAELRGKVGRFVAAGEEMLVDGELASSSVVEEALEILEQLGYGRAESSAMIARVLQRSPDITDPQELIKLVFGQTDDQ
ncbi:Holliday junction branch migration protein RuvA [candidate division KSB1 bacterium]